MVVFTLQFNVNRTDILIQIPGSLTYLPLAFTADAVPIRR